MKSEIVFDEGYQWIVMGRDPEKPQQIIDTNQYLVVSGDEAIVLDPGGIEIFAPMLGTIVKHVPLENIKYLFASHQDPDIISSLGMWDRVLTDCTLYSPWIWKGFITHFGMQHIQYQSLPDEGSDISVGRVRLQAIPAHYLHSSGNFSLYDANARILFSGDIGGALEPVDSPLFVEDMDSHFEKMRYFHQRWMPSEQAKRDWISRIRDLDVQMMLPQHGRIMVGEQVGQFLDWFETLEVGMAGKL